MRVVDYILLTLFASYFAIPVFWIPVHAGIRFARRLKGKTFYWALIAWPLTLWVFLAYFDFWYGSRFDRNAAIVALGLGLFAVEAWLGVQSGRRMGIARLAGRSEVDPQAFGGALETGAYYQHVRHPRYVAAMAATFGFAVLSGSWRLLIAAAAAVPLYYVLTALEERELVTRFPSYREYRRRVPRFVPWHRHS